MHGSSQLALGMSSASCMMPFSPRSVHMDTSSSTIPEEWRCRYKTGKCHYPRALKTNKKNGTDSFLLLCERHRRLQNKTKKRSDTKYKADRAMLRVVKRLHPELATAQPHSPETQCIATFSPSELDMLAFYLL
ncbi:hypothetical protein LEN26_020187 [Aphanomyces euteiches]|nr:hypothetical protein LEN26_020187 [Aphanomyces euteiches]KAH9102428.1 hypothetical protein AeMF1_020988 [Aphanomyces euteiches]KAH9193044.1 hypothetical protein AeNC1_004973 [Aphanomyces euteiches]